MQIIFIVLLTGVQVVTVISFVIAGFRQILRTRRLTRQANELGMQFAADDLFDIPRQYADFALISNGHSPRANNVSYGRLDGRRVRAFDFRYEVCHGTQRLTRHYMAIAIETDRVFPGVVMWNAHDADSAPLQARMADGRIACWIYTGSSETAAMLKDACHGMIDRDTSLELSGSTFMVFAHVRHGREGYGRRLDESIRAIRVIDHPTIKSRPE